MTTFASNVVQYLRPHVGAQCRVQFPSLSNGLNASNPAGLASALASAPSNINIIYFNNKQLFLKLIFSTQNEKEKNISSKYSSYIRIH